MDKNSVLDTSTALVVLSGGQDSTTVLFWALAQERFKRVVALTFDYGQRHRREVVAAKIVAGIAGVPWTCVHLGGVSFLHRWPNGKTGRYFEKRVVGSQALLRGTSPLVDQTQDVPLYEDGDSLPDGIEPTFVPMRNLLFLTLAANHAYAERAQTIIVGVSMEDYGGYPDCRSTFLYAAEDAINQAVFGKTHVDQIRGGSRQDGDEGFEIVAPLLRKTKKETVELAVRLHEEEGQPVYAALAHSHTCYHGEYPPNPNNHASLLRARGFHEAGEPDPLIMRAIEERLLPRDYPRDGYFKPSLDGDC